VRICHLIKKYGYPYLNRYKARFFRKLKFHNQQTVSRKRTIRHLFNSFIDVKYSFNLQVKHIIYRKLVELLLFSNSNLNVTPKFFLGIERREIPYSKTFTKVESLLQGPSISPKGFRENISAYWF